MSPHQSSYDSSYDVVVLGGGLAGHCAALAAAKQGAGVLLVEKQSEGGGSTVLSGGFFAFADTPMQRAAGIRDNPALLLEDLRTVGGGYAEDRLLEAYARGQRDLFDWLSALGVEFRDIELSAGQSAPRSHRTNATEVIAALNAAARKTNRVAIATEARASRLLRSGCNHPVRGVRIAARDGERDVEGVGGVVLATGGFSRSEELLRTFAPGQAEAVRIGGAGNTGDGLRLAWHLGSDMRDMGHIKGTFGTHPDCGPERHEILLLFYLGAVIVNRHGRRYVDESISYKLLGDACLQQDGAISWQVFDHAIFAEAPQGVDLFDPRPALDRRLLLTASSLEDLAVRCGIDPRGLTATIKAYNEAVGTGHDSEFGRDGLCHHVGALKPIAEPPFYAYPSTTALLATYGGLAIDEQARVIDVFGDPIEGLYAAGEITGGFHGAAYMTGTSLGKAALFGRIAGRNAAQRRGRARTRPNHGTQSGSSE